MSAILGWIVGSPIGRMVGAVGAALGLVLVGILALARMKSRAREEGRAEQRQADVTAGLEGRIAAREKVDDAYRRTGGISGDDAVDLQRLRDNRARARGP